MSEKHSHYFKEWFGKIDIYRFLKLFRVTDPAIQHAIKKLTLGGKRGAKDQLKDYQEAVDSIIRAIEMIEEDERLMTREAVEKRGLALDNQGSKERMDEFRNAATNSNPLNQDAVRNG